MKNYSKNTFTFGKYSGQKINDVEDKKYLEWLLEEAFLDCTDEISEQFIKNIEIRIEELL